MKVKRPSGKEYNYDVTHVSIGLPNYRKLRHAAIERCTRANLLLADILELWFTANKVSEPPAELSTTDGMLPLATAVAEGWFGGITYHRIWTHLTAGKISLPRANNTWYVSESGAYAVNLYFYELDN
jgi:hypothetical protein